MWKIRAPWQNMYTAAYPAYRLKNFSIAVQGVGFAPLSLVTNGLIAKLDRQPSTPVAARMPSILCLKWYGT